MTQSPREPEPYRLTLFDRHGPAAGNVLRAWSYGAMVFAIAISASLLIGHRLSFVTVVVSALLGATVIGATFGLSGMAGAGVHRFMVSGTSTPYEEQFSYQESLVMGGQVDDALASFEAIIAERADAVAARLRAAALYASRGGNPQRAAELLREVLRIPGLAARDDVAASNRLIELLAGPLGEPGRAMVELRRLIERHPGNDAAARARLMLAELKEEMARSEPRP
jgi:tetratricopeptide (TPR) repeat protein